MFRGWAFFYAYVPPSFWYLPAPSPVTPWNLATGFPSTSIHSTPTTLFMPIPEILSAITANLTRKAGSSSSLHIIRPSSPLPFTLTAPPRTLAPGRLSRPLGASTPLLHRSGYLSALKFGSSAPTNPACGYDYRCGLLRLLAPAAVWSEWRGRYFAEFVTFAGEHAVDHLNFFTKDAI